MQLSVKMFYFLIFACAQHRVRYYKTYLIAKLLTTV